MVQVENLWKSYNGIKALKNISFRIRQGELYGLLGPNGAGKTTTINILSGLLPWDGGKILINNINPAEGKILCKSISGVVPQEISLYENLSAWDNLMFWGRLYNVPVGKLKKKADSTLRLLGLSDRKHHKIKTYSGGMKRRVNIAAALLHSPEILFMDEPTVGIDPQSRNLIFQVIGKLHDDGLTIIYTTHYMEEAQRLCDRIGIIDNGEIVAQGTVDELRQISKTTESIRIRFDVVEMRPEDIPPDIRCRKFVLTENELTVFTDHAEKNLSPVIVALTDAGLPITGVKIHKADLETIFLNLTGRQLRD